jgi:hypothetical protein
MQLEKFNSLYSYKYDAFGRDSWRVLRLDKLGQYQGDCEDYALSVLFYVVSRESWLRFWMLLLMFEAKLCYVTTKNGGGHAVLRFGDMYIDNWTQDWVSKAQMKELGHQFHNWKFIPTTVAIRMMMAKLRG